MSPQTTGAGARKNSGQTVLEQHCVTITPKVNDMLWLEKHQKARARKRHANCGKVMEGPGWKTQPKPVVHVLRTLEPTNQVQSWLVVGQLAHLATLSGGNGHKWSSAFLFLVDLLVSLGSAAKNTQTIPNTIAINQHPKKVAYGTPGPRMKYLNHPLTMVRVHLALGLK